MFFIKKIFTKIARAIFFYARILHKKLSKEFYSASPVPSLVSNQTPKREVLAKGLVERGWEITGDLQTLTNFFQSFDTKILGLEG